MLVRIANVKKEYKLGSTTVEALKGISLNFLEGEFTTVAGPSGCGKSTLLNLIGCMDKPTYGNVFHDETSIGELTDRQLTSMRLHRIGFIFQSFNLIPVLSVRQNIEFPLLLLGNMAAKERRMRIDEFIEKVGLKDFSHHRSNELSGGQRQRVAVARALVTKPKIVLADEPTANLDSATGERIIELMKEMNRTLKTTFLFSTHDPAIMKHARRIVKLHDGILEEEDKA